jgi:hypothetical protein
MYALASSRLELSDMGDDKRPARGHQHWNEYTRYATIHPSSISDNKFAGWAAGLPSIVNA